jgi:hypothetical protein
MPGKIPGLDGEYPMVTGTGLRHDGRVDQSRGDVTQGTPERRELRPFPAIDPEPDHRYSWRILVRAGIGLLAACGVAAAVAGGVRLANAARHPASAAPSAPFTDSDGLIVFEQQPSGMLGTADPDGSHQVVDESLGGLQGSDLATGSPDGRYLVNQEAQLITVGARGPTAVAQLAAPDPQAETQTPGGGLEWMTPTFADGSRYLAVTECDPIEQARRSGNEAWVSWLIPTGGGRPSSLGLVTTSAGIPDSADVIAALPASPATARQQVTCDRPQLPDGSVALLSPGKSPRVIITAAALVKAAGWLPSTPVILSPYPSPDGSHLLVLMISNAPAQPGASDGGGTPGRVPAFSAQFLVSRAGRILSKLPAGTGQPVWSRDGRQVASCQAEQGQQSSVTVLSIAGARTTAMRTITLPGHRDAACDQLLWSPDGTQLIYSAFATSHGLTQADDLQHGWTIIDPASGKVHDVTASGQPAGWLP